jgi:hypothetical protein
MRGALTTHAVVKAPRIDLGRLSLAMRDKRAPRAAAGLDPAASMPAVRERRARAERKR